MTDQLIDAGPCTDCGCGQWQHRQGKKGCKDPECGCGKYAPPKTPPERPTSGPASGLALLAELDDAAKLRARVAVLEDLLDQTCAARDRFRRERDQERRANLATATRALWRYDAEQCQTCGYRTTVPVAHAHPLTPVTVLIVRRTTTEGETTE